MTDLTRGLQMHEIMAGLNDGSLTVLPTDAVAKLRATSHGLDYWTDTCERVQSQRDELVRGAQLLLDQYDRSGDFTMGGKLTNEPFIRLREAVKRVLDRP